MAAPEGRKLVKPFNPPTWMRDGALRAIAQMSPQDMSAKLQKAAEDAKKNSPTAIKTLERIVPAREKLGATPFSVAQRAQQQISGEPVDAVRQQQRVERRKSSEVIEAAPRVLQVQNRDERRPNKRTNTQDQAASRMVKKSKPHSTPSPIDTPSSSKMAGSSTTRAQWETNAASTEPMEVDSPESLFISEIQGGYPVEENLPLWHVRITDASFSMKQLALKGASALKDLDKLKISINNCEASDHFDPALHDKLRNSLHKIDIDSKVDRFIIKKSRILTPELGLPRIFRKGASFPRDLKADAYQLYTRWMAEDFDRNILRGIVTKKGDKRNGDSLDPARMKTHPKSAKYHGAGTLVIGQWWPTQLSTLRDGAHGATQGGIFGDPDKGAYSIVLSGGGSYDDTDDGDVIEYSGTASKTDEPTTATVCMLTSVESKEPIRVLRSSQLSMKNKYRPSVGLRYDGLYVAQSSKLVDGKTHMYRFRLLRCPGQDPIRYRPGPSRRPTKEEERAFEALKSKFWR